MNNVEKGGKMRIWRLWGRIEREEGEVICFPLTVGNKSSREVGEGKKERGERKGKVKEEEYEYCWEGKRKKILRLWGRKSSREVGERKWERKCQVCGEEF